MRVTRWGTAAALGVVAALAAAAPAAGQVNPPIMQDDPELEVLDEHDGLTVLQAACADGGQVTVTAAGITYHVSSQVRTAGLSARIGDQAVAQEQVEQDDGEYVADEVIVLEAPEADGVLEYRWFAGPDRADLPAWTATGPADEGWDAAVAEIVALEATEGRPWDARDSGPFVQWYSVEVTGCPAPASPTPEATTAAPTPGASEGPAPGAGGEQLPQTGVSTGVIALGAVVLLVVGGGLYLVARRRRVSFTA